MISIITGEYSYSQQKMPILSHITYCFITICVSDEPKYLCPWRTGKTSKDKISDTKELEGEESLTTYEPKWES